jgi:rubrerythrin
MEQYDALANEAPPGPVAHPFRYQANEELEHKRELENMYCEIVRSGGV